MNLKGLSAWGRYWVETYDADVLADHAYRNPGHVVVLLMLLLAVYRWQTKANVEEVRRFEQAVTSRPRFVLWGLALFAFVVTATLGQIGFGGIPHVQDEIAYFFQAKVFAAGHLSGPRIPEKVFEAVSTQLLANAPPGWVGVFPPGWSVALAAGLKLGLPGLVNPMLAVGILLLINRRILSPFSIGPRLVGLGLLVTSPFFIMQCSSLMSHGLGLFLFLLGLEGLERLEKNPISGALLLSLSSGAMALARPQDVLPLMVIPYLIGFVRIWRGASSRRSIAVVMLTLPLCVALLTLAAYNHHLTSRLSFPVWLANKGTTMGWSATAGDYQPQGHTPMRSLHNLWVTVRVLTEDLFGWCLISLLPAAIGIFADGPPIGILGVTGVALVCNYALYFQSSIILGARYYFPLLPVLLLLTLRGLGAIKRRYGPVVLFTALVYLTIQSAITYWPTRLERLPLFWDVARGLAELVPERGIVLIPNLTINGRRDLIDSFYSVQDPMLESRVLIRDAPYLKDRDYQTAFPGWPIHRLQLADIKAKLAASLPKAPELVL